MPQQTLGTTNFFSLSHTRARLAWRPSTIPPSWTQPPRAGFPLSFVGFSDSSTSNLELDHLVEDMRQTPLRNHEASDRLLHVSLQQFWAQRLGLALGPSWTPRPWRGDPPRRSHLGHLVTSCARRCSALASGSVLKWPIERTFDLDQVAVGAVEGPVVVTACPETIGALPRTRELSILARGSSWWRRPTRHALRTSNLPHSARRPPLSKLRAAGCGWLM